MKFRYLCILLVLLALMLPYFALSQTSGWDNLQTTTTFGFGSQKFNSQLASAFKVQVPFPIYIQGKITTVLAPWWLLVLVFMIVYPILDIIFGIVPPFSKARERGLSGVETSKTVFTIGFTLLAMFVTPLVPSVVELVAFGTTAGIFWFWMLVIVIIVWGTNWLFGESAFGDPFRTGAAGLGHIGSAGMTKFKKHFREEMNDTTNEAKYLTDLDALMNQNFKINHKERSLIKNLWDLLQLLIQARNTKSSATRPILDKMKARLLELKALIEGESQLIPGIKQHLDNLNLINQKGDKIISDLKRLTSEINSFVIKLKNSGANSLKVDHEYEKTTYGALGNLPIPVYIKEIEDEVKKDYLLDLKQANIATKSSKLTSLINSPIRQEVGIIQSMVSSIDEILQTVVSPSKVNKFIQLARKFIWYLQQIEKNNSIIMEDLVQTLRKYHKFLISEQTGTNSISYKLEKLDRVISQVTSNGSF